jgi:hypothetical protein
MNKKSLVIWLPNGNTMEFKEVQDFEMKEVGAYTPIESISFNYKEEWTGEFKEATFFTDKINGYSITGLERESEC